MANNKVFNIKIWWNGVDYAEYISLKDFEPFARNLDFSQIYSRTEISISSKIGLAYQIQKNDIITIEVDSLAHTYFVGRLKVNKSNITFNLINIFENLEEVEFFVFDEDGDYIINSEIEDYVEIVDQTEETLTKLLDDNLFNLLIPVFKVLVGKAPILSFVGEIKDYEEVDKNALYWANMTFNTIIKVDKKLEDSNYRSWYFVDDDISTDFGSLFKTIQKVFHVNFSYNYETNILYIYSMPIMLQEEAKTLISTKYTDPSFFNVNNYLNPALSLAVDDFKTAKDTSEVLTDLRESYQVSYSKYNTSTDEDDDIFCKKYNNIFISDPEEITFPDNFNYKFELNSEDTTKVPNVLEITTETERGKISFILSAGLYSSYARFFCQNDTVKVTRLKLNYQVPISYKKELSFIQQLESIFTFSVGARSIKYDIDNYLIKITSNIPKTLNNIGL